VRYEHDLAALPTTYAGLGHAQRFPDYWELFSPKLARPARPTPSTASSRRRPPSSTSASSTDRTPGSLGLGLCRQVRDYILFDYRPA
jgi:iron complex outermembrane receptor protein